MRRLADGAYAVISATALDSEVRSLEHPRTLSVPAAHADALRRLSQGLSADGPATPLFQSLQRAGLADEDLEPVDPVVEQRLAELGAPFSWHLDDVPQAEELVTLLRRVHARRKFTSLQFGQASCLPESGILRCAQLSRVLGRKKRVLLVGDDDFLCVPLARLGFAVTVVDVDPMLVEFLSAVVAEEGLRVDLRVQDVLQPFPEDLVNRFDAVLTDPMSYEPCLTAFLTRAVQALKEGGKLFCCVHPLARKVAEDVVRRLPLALERCFYELSVYYYEGYVENPYRSDFYLFTRTAGDAPWAPTEELPLGDIISGAFKNRMHGHTDIQTPPWRRPEFATLKDAALAFLERAQLAVVSRHEHETEAAGHLYVALDNLGHLALVFDKKRGVLSYDVYPFTLTAETGLAAAFARVVPMGKNSTFSREVADLAAPTVKMPARKRKNGR